ncbi:MAG: hypothetical protein Q9184_005899, partial [Pyrenodesmia sp. 2 TL-2023]
NRTKKGGQDLIGGLDVKVNRNYFGRQTESFEADLDLPFLSDTVPSSAAPFRGFFIRAPVVEKILPSVTGEQTEEAQREETVIAPGKDNIHCEAWPVEIMATLPGRSKRLAEKVEVAGLKEDIGDIIAVKQRNVFGTSFHPELTPDARIHVWWLRQVLNNGANPKCEALEATWTGDRWDSKETNNSGSIGYRPFTYAFQASSTRTAGALPASAVFFFLFQSLFSNGAAISASSRIVLVSILIAHLTARLSSPEPMISMGSGQPRQTFDLPVLPAFLKARVEISPDDPLIELGPTNVLHTVQSILTPSPLATQNGFKVPTNGDYQGPQRTIACRNTEVFVVVDNEIRWSDLSMLKYDWESSQGPRDGLDNEDRGAGQIYKTLEVPISEHIRQLLVSPNGQFLAIATSHTIHVTILPSSSKFDESAGTSIKVKTHTLGPTAHVLNRSPIVSVLWHPCGVQGSCLVTVTTEAVVRLWELNQLNRWSFDAPTIAIDLRKLDSATSQKDDVTPRSMSKNRGFSADMIDLEIASACFGGTGASNESSWSAITLWTVTTEGDVYALCPLLPSKWQPTVTQIPSLTAIADIKRESPSSSPPQKPDTRIQDDQWNWLSEIDAQDPIRGAGENGIVAQNFTYNRPDHPGPIPRLQGPFKILAESSDEYLEVSDIRVIASRLDTEELMHGEDDGSDQGLQEDTDGLSSAIVCLLTTDGKVHVYLDLDGVEGQWLPAKAPKIETPKPETTQLLAIEVLETLDPKTITEYEWPTFSDDPFSRYAFFITHSQGIFYFSFDPWINRLEDELQSATTHGAQKRLSTIRASTNTLRERILRFNHDSPSPSANACLAIYDSDLGYFLLTSTDNNKHPHAASLDIPKSALLNHDPLSSLEPNDDPAAYSDDDDDYPKPFTHLVTRPAYEPSPIFWQPSSLPSIAHTVPPHRRRMLKEEIRLSSATLDLLLHTSRLVGCETQNIQSAAADLINRCYYMMQEMAEQLKQVRLAAARAENLQNSGGGGEEEHEDGGGGGEDVNTRIERRLDRAKQRDGSIKERMTRLKRKVTQLEERPLNDKERDFERELRALERATEPRTEVDDADAQEKENGHSNGEGDTWWYRYELVKHLKEELVEAAAQVGDGTEKMEEDSEEDEDVYSVPNEMRRRKVQQVMGLLERESALVEAVTARLERLGVGVAAV